MTGMTPERLADIEARHATGLGRERPGDVAALLREVKRLRSIEVGVEALADEWRSSLNPPADVGMEAFVASEWAGCLRANLTALDALLNPTEGQDHGSA